MTCHLPPEPAAVPPRRQYPDTIVTG